VRRALAAAGRRAEEVAMLEAHGTATMIGDPIELRALTEVFRRETDRSGFCAIGSVKSNVGHLLSAAGIAGLFKALLAVEHGEIPPTLFCETPNPRFDFAASPFYPNTALRSWPAGEPRVAGVSAFGLGGTNAHAIVTGLDAAPSSVRRAPLPPPVFRRRRLWWERTAPAGFAVPPKKDVPSTPIAPTTPELVASVLDLAFH
jgi:acyl transferase domain-containing protein